MPSTVADIFAATGLASEGAVRWREPVPDERPGVYVVALTEQADSLEGVLPEAPITLDKPQHLLSVRPELTLDGRHPTAAELAERISAFWFPDEVILYIGLATSLGSRVGSYYRTRLGQRRPHAGGWWLKVLADDVLAALRIHYATTTSPAAAEDEMIRAYCAGVSTETLTMMRDTAHPFPFANLAWHTRCRKLRKAHGIKNATGRPPRAKQPAGR